MIRNYFTVALRHLSRSKVYSTINIFGLSLGLACAMLIVLFTKDEISFDRFHKNEKDIHRIVTEVRMPDGSFIAGLGQVSIPLAPLAADIIPQVESFVRLRADHFDVKFDDAVRSQAITAVDTNFFSFFSFPLIKGDPRSVLRTQHSIVLTEDLVTKYFGTEDPIDKTILINESGEFKSFVVTGVAKRCPENSSIQFEAVIPMVVPPQMQTGTEAWMSSGLYAFVTVKRGSDIPKIEQLMQDIYEAEAKEAIEAIKNLGYQEQFVSHLQPLRDIHLSSTYRADGHGVDRPGETAQSYTLLGIAALVLLIACFNFINLTIARSVKRAKEIGIRKISGGRKKDLVQQFIGEAFLFCSISFLGALLLAQLVLPSFNDLVNKNLSLQYLFDIDLVAGYVVLFLVSGILAGSYPAFIMSGYNPAAILYNRFKLGGRSYLQKGLVIFQFTLATILVVGCLIIYSQVDFLVNKNLGYNDDNVVVVSKSGISGAEVTRFRTELMKYPDIKMVAPEGGSGMDAKFDDGRTLHFAYEAVDENFFPLLQLSIVEGRNFSADFATDSAKAVIVNERFVREAGWDEPVGKELSMFPYDGEKVVVVGVVKDYHYQKPTQVIEPQLFIPRADVQYRNPYNLLLIRIKPGTMQSSLTKIESSFKKIFPLTPYSYDLLDEANRTRYESEQRWGKIVLFGAVLTIFISVIGLFGLTLLMSEKRNKEIGIRKVLGASSQRIAALLSIDYLKLVIIALMIATPLSWYLADNWLSTYPYRVDVGAPLFVIAGLIVVLISMLTVGYQSFKAALTNPVEIIRNE